MYDVGCSIGLQVGFLWPCLSNKVYLFLVGRGGFHVAYKLTFGSKFWLALYVSLAVTLMRPNPNPNPSHTCRLNPNHRT